MTTSKMRSQRIYFFGNTSDKERHYPYSAGGKIYLNNFLVGSHRANLLMSRDHSSINPSKGVLKALGRAAHRERRKETLPTPHLYKETLSFRKLGFPSPFSAYSFRQHLIGRRHCF